MPPTDTLTDLRTEMALTLEAVGIPVEVFHHEVASGGQCELSMKFNSLKTMADWTMWYKYVVKNVSRKHGKTATFMPKPIFGDNGSGMHCHQSIWKDEKNLFAGDKYAGLSDMALNYIGGILKHAPALCAFTNPGTNSYKRLVPGYEAPVNLAYSSRNRSASVRIPIGSASPKAKRLEFRCPDPTANPYIAFSAMLMAGLDGIQNKIDPGKPLDKDIYALSPEESKDVPKAPGSLDEALKALERDHAFLLKGDVFTSDVINDLDRLQARERGGRAPAAPAPATSSRSTSTTKQFRTAQTGSEPPADPGLRTARRSDHPVGLSAVFRLAPVPLWALTPSSELT